MIDNLFPNWLIVKPHNITKIGGIWIPDNVNKDWVNFSGTVVKICGELRYEQGNENTMQWDVDKELMVGDTVWYNGICNMEAKPRSPQNKYGMGRGFEENGEYYMFMHYQDVFVAKRGDKVVCVNGFILGEPVKEDSYSGKIILINQPESFKNRCTIRHIGKPLREYKFGVEHQIVPPDDPSIKEGDEVLLMPNGGIGVDESRNGVEDGKYFYRFRRHDIIAKIVDNKLQPVSDRVLIKEENQDKVLKSGLILLDKTELRGDGRWGEVVGHGGLCRGTKNGQKVFYSHSESVDLEFDGETYQLCRERDILLENDIQHPTN